MLQEMFPLAKKTNVQRQPMTASIGGTRWIDTIVKRKPTQVCTVTMVPTRSRSDSSTTLAENFAESRFNSDYCPYFAGFAQMRPAQFHANPRNGGFWHDSEVPTRLS
jgi:hypothetical protein